MNFLEFASSLPLIKNVVWYRPDSWHTPKGAFISHYSWCCHCKLLQKKHFKIPLLNKVCFQAENSFVVPGSTKQAKGKAGEQETKQKDDVAVNVAVV